MSILEIIAKKRDKKELSKQEIEFFINEYTKNNITEYQAAALIMAIYINGMNMQETFNLTMAMAKSGDILDLSSISNNIVDKHSIGGVGDNVTLILLPIIASLGIPVAKMSGRSLEFTGGTADKLEAIPGYRTEVAMEEFIGNVKNIGISLIAQENNLAPADKKLYALRDTISCTGSIPLIASSIMSKKIASGANKIVLDITVGSGAFMKTVEEAEQLANMMIEIGKSAGKEIVCVLTDMDEPLGYAVGNTLEVIEAINFFKSKMPEDLKKVVLELGSYMLKLAGFGDDLEKNKESMLKSIESTKAFETLLKLVKNQGGDVSYINEIENFGKAEFIIPVASTHKGYVEKLNAQVVGEIANNLGAGRNVKAIDIDKEVGVILRKKVGDHVKKGEILAFIHANNKRKGERFVEILRNAYSIVEGKVEKKKTIIKVVE